MQFKYLPLLTSSFLALFLSVACLDSSEHEAPAPNAIVQQQIASDTIAQEPVTNAAPSESEFDRERYHCRVDGARHLKI